MTEIQAERCNTRRGPRGAAGASGSGGFYFFGFIGALVWFWQAAEGVGEHLVGVLQAFVWPAFLVYEAFRALRG